MEDKRAMEDVFRRSERRGAAAAGEEKRVIDSAGDNHKEEIPVKVGEKRPYNDKNQSSAKQKHLSCSEQDDDQLETARAEMGEVRQENQRLKMYLDRITKDYQTLQMQFVNIVQQEAKKSTETTSIDRGQETEEPDQLVSLSLGRFSSDSKKDEKNKLASCRSSKEEEQVEEGLSLALDCKFEASKSDANESLTNPSPGQSLNQEPKEEAGETWPPNKGLNKKMSSGDDEVLQQSQVKRARVSVRARCDTPTMNDGCQWRKYGQKIAKGNPCPRAYYRCTVAPSCPVRKQVQRYAEDMSILITTYEGTHNHPLSVSATAMASTTSAAASMLLSGSSSSSGPGSSAPNNLNGLSFYQSDNSKSKQFYTVPNSSSLSTSPLHPTITLDLTTTAPSQLISRFTSNYPQSAGPRYSSTNLNFSSSESSSSINMSWGNGLLSYGSNTQPYIKNNQFGSLNLGRQPIENLYQSYLQNPNPNPNLHQQPLPAETIEAATKAITADPSFHSALAAALKSIIGNGNGNGSGITGGANQVSGDSFGQKLKWGEQFPVASSYSETVKGSGCASSYLNKSSSASSHQPGSLIFMPPNSLQFSTPKSASASPADDREHTD